MYFMFDRHGYNQWRDAMKPTQILARLCKEAKMDTPIYNIDGTVKIGRLTFTVQPEEVDACNNVRGKTVSALY